MYLGGKSIKNIKIFYCYIWNSRVRPKPVLNPRSNFSRNFFFNFFFQIFKFFLCFTLLGGCKFYKLKNKHLSSKTYKNNARTGTVRSTQIRAEFPIKKITLFVDYCTFILVMCVQWFNKNHNNNNGFRGLFKDGKKYPILLVTRFSLWNVVSVSVTVSAESINQFRFRFRYRTETKIVVLVVH